MVERRVRVEVLASACALSACLSVGCTPPPRHAFDPPLALRERAPHDADTDSHDIDRWVDPRTRRAIVVAVPIHVEHLPLSTPPTTDADAADPHRLVAAGRLGVVEVDAGGGSGRPFVARGADDLGPPSCARGAADPVPAQWATLAPADDPRWIEVALSCGWLDRSACRLRPDTREGVRAPEIAPQVYAFRRCPLDCSVSTELVLVFPAAARLLVHGDSAPPLRGAFTLVRLPLDGADGVAASILAEVDADAADAFHTRLRDERAAPHWLALPLHIGAELIATTRDPAPLFTLFSPRHDAVVERAARSSVRARVRSIIHSDDP